jgi:hypothetical protein
LAASIDADNSDDSQVVRDTILAVLARQASDDEVRDGVALIEKLESQYGIARSRAVQLYCMTVMNWNEFLFID